MGIRFRMFLLDRAPFEALLDRSMGELFDELALRPGVDVEDLILIADHDRDVALIPGPDGRLQLDPATGALSVRGYLEVSWAGCLEGILSALATTDPGAESAASRGRATSMADVASAHPPESPAGLRVVRLLCDHRRWWLGTLLRSFEASPHLELEVPRMAALAVRLVRSLDCGFPLPLDPGLQALDLPVRPPHDCPDLQLGAWGAADLRYAWGVLERFVEQGGVGGTLRGRSATGLAQDTDWATWVNEVVVALLAGRTQGFREPILISFLS